MFYTASNVLLLVTLLIHFFVDNFQLYVVVYYTSDTKKYEANMVENISHQLALVDKIHSEACHLNDLHVIVCICGINLFC